MLMFIWLHRRWVYMRWCVEYFGKCSYALMMCFYPDVDECSTSEILCHVNASCYNTKGNYGCQCLPGFTGDGFNCSSKNWTSRLQLFACRRWKPHCLVLNVPFFQILMNVQVQITVALMLTALTTSEAMIVPVLLVMLVMDIRVMVSLWLPSAKLITMIGRIAPSWHGVARQVNVTYCELLLITPKTLFTDFDECSNATIFPCHPVANCTNTVGSFSCTCLSGY